MHTLILRSLLALALATSSLIAYAAPAAVTIRMQVSGLVCGFCAQGIDKQMRSFEGTQDVYVNLERGVVAVELDPGADLSDEQLDKALTDAGYTLTGITRVERSLAQVRDEIERGDE